MAGEAMAGEAMTAEMLTSDDPTTYIHIRVYSHAVEKQF